MNKFKKSKIIFAILFCLILLSGCHLPFTKKEFTLPLFEKEPKEVIARMQKKIENSVGYEYSFETKLSFITQENKDDTKKSTLLMPFYLFPSTVIKNVTINIDGKTTRKDSAKDTEKNIKIKAELEGMEVKGDLAVKNISKVVYINIGELPYPLTQFVKAYANQWWKIDINELNSKLPDWEKKYGISTSSYSQYEIASEQKKIAEEIEQAFWKSNLLSINNRLSDEKIKDKATYHYTFKIEKSQLAKYLGDVDTIINNHNQKKKSEEELAEMKKKFERFSDSLSKSEGEIWIDKKDFYPHRIIFSASYPPPKESGISKQYSRVDLNFSGNFKNFDKSTSIETPKEVKSILDEVEEKWLKPMQGARQTSRDYKRLSDIKQIQTALELHYSDTDHYPESLEFGSKIEAPAVNGITSPQVYMSKIPENPRPNDGECPEDFNYSYRSIDKGRSYELNYCLGSATGNVPAGISTATPAGLFIEKIYDTDKDGLYDFEEANIYKTDEHNKDSDKDGFLDGSEVVNGYNPLGSGKFDLSSGTPEFLLIKMEKTASKDPDFYVANTDFSPELEKFLKDEINLSSTQYIEAFKKEMKYESKIYNIEQVNILNRKEIDKDHLFFEYHINYKPSASGIKPSYKSDASFFVKKNNRWYLDLLAELEDMKKNEPREWTYFKMSGM